MKMLAENSFEEITFSNSEIAQAKKLLNESVHQVAEAVNSIALPETEELGKFQVIVLNTWDDGNNHISIPENFILSSKEEENWEAFERNVILDNNEKQEEKKNNEEGTENLSWLLNFKVESLFHPLDTNGGNDFAAGNMNEMMERKKEELPRREENKYKKPPFTYTELIEQALTERGALTVSGIYKWISQNFPYYRKDDDRWKNSVRHNLSINPHFSKGGKASKGAGHLWTVVSGEDRSRSSWKRRRLEQFVNEQRRKKAEDGIHSGDDEANKAAQLLADENMTDDVLMQQQSWVGAEIISLEETASDILMGVKRQVEVEYLPTIGPDDDRSADSGDFLNPISKEKAVEESGLLSDDIQYSDINPVHDVPFFSDEEMTLQYYELALSSSHH